MSPYRLAIAAAAVLAAGCTPQEVGLVLDTASEAAVLTGHPAIGAALYCVEAFCPTGPQ